MPIQDKFYSRLGPTVLLCDGYGVVTSRTGDGNLTGTVTGLTVDMGAAGQAPYDGLNAMYNIAVASVVFVTGTAVDIVIKVEWADTGTPGTTTLGTVRHTDTAQTITVTAAAPTKASVAGVQVTLPQIFKMNLANVPHRYARISATYTMTGGGTANTGASSLWFDDSAEDHPYALSRID